MDRILVPLDFSSNSLHALRYAQQLAAALGGIPVHLMYVWHPTLYPVDAPGSLPVTYTENTGRVQLQAFADEYGIPESETTLEVGFPAERIVEASKLDDIDLIVLGSAEREPGLADRLVGTIATEVCEDAHCPVLVVPEGKDFGQGFEHILYASSSSATDESTVTRVMDLARRFRADVHFVHVQTDDDEEDVAEAVAVENTLFEELHSDTKLGLRAQLVTITDDSVVEGLTQYAEENDIDLMVSVTRRRSWWQSLFERSQTKQLTLYAELPLLVLHLDDHD